MLAVICDPDSRFCRAIEPRAPLGLILQRMPIESRILKPMEH